MRISKRDAQMLILLVVVLVVAGFYWLVYLPQETALQSLKDEKALLDQQRQAIDTRLAVEATLNSDFEAVEQLLIKVGNQYFSKLHQEVIMMIIQDLFKESGVNVKGVTYSEQITLISEMKEATKTELGVDPFTAPEDTANNEDSAAPPAPVSDTPTADVTGQPEEQPASTEIKTVIAQIQFSGSYKSLEFFLTKVYKYPKHIILQSINIANDKKGNLTGSVTLEFYGIPKIQVATEVIKGYFKTQSKRPTIADVYLPYPNFINVAP